MDAVVFGSIIMDTIIYSSKVKKIEHKSKKYFGLDYGSKIEIDKLEFDPGGSGHNVAVGLSKLGRKVGLIGKIGNDIFGNMIINSIKKSKIDAKYVKKTNTITGASFVVIGESKERSILINRGANDFVDVRDINENYIKKFKWFVFTSVLGKKSIKALKKAVNIARKNKLKIVANPSISMIKNKKSEINQLIGKSDIIIMNEEEASQITRSKKINEMLLGLNKMGPSIVVITLGKRGVVAFDGKKKYRQKAYRVKVIDTTGAGDCFTAGFLHSLMKNNDIKYALKFGVATAALNLKTYGAVKNFPSETKINKEMKCFSQKRI